MQGYCLARRRKTKSNPCGQECVPMKPVTACDYVIHCLFYNSFNCCLIIRLLLIERGAHQAEASAVNCCLIIPFDPCSDKNLSVFREEIINTVFFGKGLTVCCFLGSRVDAKAPKCALRVGRR